MAEFTHSFADKEGNTLAYLCISSADAGESSTVTLQFADKKSPAQCREALQECQNLARMLNIEYTVENINPNEVPRSIVFKTEDRFTTAMLLTSTLEHNAIIGEGAYASLENALLDAGHIHRADPMKLALEQAQQSGIKPLVETDSAATDWGGGGKAMTQRKSPIALG